MKLTSLLLAIATWHGLATATVVPAASDDTTTELTSAVEQSMDSLDSVHMDSDPVMVESYEYTPAFNSYNVDGEVEVAEPIAPETCDPSCKVFFGAPDAWHIIPSNFTYFETGVETFTYIPEVPVSPGLFYADGDRLPLTNAREVIPCALNENDEEECFPGVMELQFNPGEDLGEEVVDDGHSFFNLRFNNITSLLAAKVMNKCITVNFVDREDVNQGCVGVQLQTI